MVKGSVADRFQRLMGGKAWCYEVDHFAVFVMAVQLLCQSGDEVEDVVLDMDVEGLVKYIDGRREEKGFEKLHNVATWSRLLDMLRMREEVGVGEVYRFERMGMDARRQWMQQCYAYCVAELVDLENLKPKLRSILAKLDRAID